MKLKSKHRFAALGLKWAALATVTAIALTACSGSENNSPTPPPAATDAVDPYSPEVSHVTTVQYANPAAASLYAALDDGIAASYGIDIEMTLGENGPAILPLLVTGNVPIGGLNPFFTISAVLGGADVRIIGEMIRGAEHAQTIEVMPESGIEELSDLVGKKVGVQGLNGGHEAQLRYAMIQAGLDADSVEFVNVGFNEAPAALEQGTVDAASVTGPPLTQAKNELNTRTVFDYAGGDLYKGFPAFLYVASGEFVDANPNTIAAFQCAVVVKGAERVESDQAYYEEMLSQIGLSEAAIEQDVKFIYPAANDAAHMQISADIMSEIGWIDAPFDIASITVPVPDNC